MTAPIAFPGDPDAGGRDVVAGTVADAMANAMDRRTEMQGDTYGLGSTIGDVLTLPTASSTGAYGGSYYDPPRGYDDGPDAA